MTDTQPLYDLAPVLELMLLGLVIALGPLVWVWARNRRSSPMRRLQALTVLTLFLTFDLVLFGAFTYIGNGPNFMVKAIAESAGIKMPTFFAYVIRYSIPFLLPALLLVWFLVVHLRLF